jgi:hypothetical protein
MAVCGREQGKKERAVGCGGQRLFKRLGGAGQRGKKGRGPYGCGRVEKEKEGRWGAMVRWSVVWGGRQ